MKLYIDIGNSYIKSVEDKDGLGEITSILNDEHSLEMLFSKYVRNLETPEQIIVSDVVGGKVAEIISNICRREWAISPKYLEVSKESCNVHNGYNKFSQLGIDRWAGIIGAWNKYKSCLCIVDCGSTVTLDIVLESGEHQGGYIIPGNYLMMRTLVENTSKILVTTSEITSVPGRSTVECMANGTTSAVSSFIENKFNSLNNAGEKIFRCVITGGGADVIMEHLTISYDYDPLLVIEGMKMINEASL